MCRGPDASVFVPVSKVMPMLFFLKGVAGPFIGPAALTMCFSLNHSTLLHLSRWEICYLPLSIHWFQPGLPSTRFSRE